MRNSGACETTAPRGRMGWQGAVSSNDFCPSQESELGQKTEARVGGSAVMRSPGAVDDAAVRDVQMDIVTAGRHAGRVQRPGIAGSNRRLNRAAARADGTGERQGAEAVEAEVGVASDEVPVQHRPYPELSTVAGAVDVHRCNRGSVVELDPVNVRNRAQHRVVKLIRDLDLHFPQ